MVLIVRMDDGDPRIAGLDVKRLLLRFFEGIWSLFCFDLIVLCVVFVSIVVASFHFVFTSGPPTLTVTLESMSVRNLNLSTPPTTAAAAAMADWNFTIFITNQNSFGLSYEFKSFMYDSESNNTLSIMLEPIISQGPKSRVTVAVAFPSVWTPLTQGGNSDIGEISVDFFFGREISSHP